MGVTGGRMPIPLDRLAKAGEITLPCDNMSGGELNLQVWKDKRQGGIYASLTVWKAGRPVHVILREEKLRALGLLALMHVPEPPAPVEVAPVAEQRELFS